MSDNRGCKFNLVGVQCGHEFINADGWCEEHAAEKCVSCGAHAIGQCTHEDQFVCGYPLCGDCHHGRAPGAKFDSHVRKPGRGRGRINIVFTGEGPNLAFAEVQDAAGKGVKIGRWFHEGTLTVLAIDSLPETP